MRQSGIAYGVVHIPVCRSSCAGTTLPEGLFVEHDALAVDGAKDIAAKRAVADGE